MSKQIKKQNAISHTPTEYESKANPLLDQQGKMLLEKVYREQESDALLRGTERKFLRSELYQWGAAAGIAKL